MSPWRSRYQGARVAAIDLDPRQRTLHRYLENRAETERRRGISLPRSGIRVFEGDTVRGTRGARGSRWRLAPGFRDRSTRPGATTPSLVTPPPRADTLVTPLNDSFVDFDLIGQVDAETFKVRRLSFYAELIWEARKKRAMATIRDRREMDWVVVRNRTSMSRRAT